MTAYTSAQNAHQVAIDKQNAFIESVSNMPQMVAMMEKSTFSNESLSAVFANPETLAAMPDEQRARVMENATMYQQAKQQMMQQAQLQLNAAKIQQAGDMAYAERSGELRAEGIQEGLREEPDTSVAFNGNNFVESLKEQGVEGDAARRASTLIEDVGRKLPALRKMPYEERLPFAKLFSSWSPDEAVKAGKQAPDMKQIRSTFEAVDWPDFVEGGVVDEIVQSLAELTKDGSDPRILGEFVDRIKSYTTVGALKGRQAAAESGSN